VPAGYLSFSKIASVICRVVGRTLTDCLRAAVKRIISYVRTLPSCTTSVIACGCGLALRLRRHDRASSPPKESCDWIHDGGSVPRTWARIVRWFEDGTSSPMLPKPRIESAHQPCEGVGKDVAERIRGDNELVFFVDSCSATSAGRRCSWTRARCPDNSSRLLSPLLPHAEVSRTTLAFRKWSRLEATFLCVFKAALTMR